MLKENQLCLIVGGGEHRPEDIGLTCVTYKFLRPGEEGQKWSEDTNDCGESAWLVDIDGDGAFKRAEWLLPIDDYKPCKLEDIYITIHTKVI